VPLQGVSSTAAQWVTPLFGVHSLYVPVAVGVRIAVEAADARVGVRERQIKLKRNNEKFLISCDLLICS
jgi:hypothetical protein